MEVGWRWWSEAGDQAQVGAFLLLLAGTDCPARPSAPSPRAACSGRAAGTSAHSPRMLQRDVPSNNIDYSRLMLMDASMACPAQHQGMDQIHGSRPSQTVSFAVAHWMDP